MLNDLNDAKLLNEKGDDIVNFITDIDEALSVDELDRFINRTIFIFVVVIVVTQSGVICNVFFPCLCVLLCYPFQS